MSSIFYHLLGQMSGTPLQAQMKSTDAVTSCDARKNTGAWPPLPPKMSCWILPWSMECLGGHEVRTTSATFEWQHCHSVIYSCEQQGKHTKCTSNCNDKHKDCSNSTKGVIQVQITLMFLLNTAFWVMMQTTKHTDIWLQRQVCVKR